MNEYIYKNIFYYYQLSRSFFPKANIYFPLMVSLKSPKAKKLLVMYLSFINSSGFSRKNLLSRLYSMFSIKLAYDTKEFGNSPSTYFR